MTTREWCRTLGERRIAAGMTQQRLADRAGVSVSTISGIERGNTVPSTRVSTAIEIALVASSTRPRCTGGGARLASDDIRRMFDMAVVTEIDASDVALYVVSPA